MLVRRIKLREGSDPVDTLRYNFTTLKKTKPYCNIQRAVSSRIKVGFDRVQIRVINNLYQIEIKLNYAVIPYHILKIKYLPEANFFSNILGSFSLIDKLSTISVSLKC
jgi:hypothetical protein